MANDSFLTKLLGGGEAREAGETVSVRKRYNRYVTETQSRGEDPLSFEEWRKQNGS